MTSCLPNASGLVRSLMDSRAHSANRRWLHDTLRFIHSLKGWCDFPGLLTCYCPDVQLSPTFLLLKYLKLKSPWQRPHNSSLKGLSECWLFWRRLCLKNSTAALGVQRITLVFQQKLLFLHQLFLQPMTEGESKHFSWFYCFVNLQKSCHLNHNMKFLTV